MSDCVSPIAPDWLNVGLLVIMTLMLLIVFVGAIGMLFDVIRNEQERREEKKRREAGQQ